MNNVQARIPKKSELQQSDRRTTIDKLNREMVAAFMDKLTLDHDLSRTIVSFQANRERSFYKWFKFKEAFSASLVELLLTRYGLLSGRLLDPFAGIGTSLFAASELGVDSDGIELLPVAQEIIKARATIEREFSEKFVDRLKIWVEERPWEQTTDRKVLNTLRITHGAYPPDTHAAIESYLHCLEQEEPAVQTALRLALLCVLEQVSYTRKDGQYLRWDYRSGRKQGGKKFNKGSISSFGEAIIAKLTEILNDLFNKTGTLQLPFGTTSKVGEICLLTGSCLDILPTLPSCTYDVIITSPPYCNRYDYTRTYALELAILGLTEKDIVNLRQQMLSCTVENREKDLLQMNSNWTEALAVANRQELLQSIIHFLSEQKANGHLNNSGIPRMVRGYFYEMACVIAECARILRAGAPLFMVNDNVRYAGVEIPVDLILSDFARSLGFEVENILVLPNGKGNSSQQMGMHGRIALRKCVYVWRRR